MRRSLLERHPWIALNLFEAFKAAKQEAANTARDVLDGFVRTGLTEAVLVQATQTDPMAYGVKAAREELETIADYVHEQGLSGRRVRIDELFAPSTLNL